jgi:uncharacterized OsmC-like protein
MSPPTSPPTTPPTSALTSGLAACEAQEKQEALADLRDMRYDAEIRVRVRIDRLW